MKKFVLFVLCIFLIGTLFANNVYAAVGNDDEIIMPLNNNTSTTKTDFNIDSNGYATISVKYIGYSGITTGGVITTKLQKLNSSNVWEDVSIGTENNVWIAESNRVVFFTSYNYQLTSYGLYRVSAEYRISGNGGSDDIITTIVEKRY